MNHHIPREYCSIHSNKGIFPREYCSIHSNKSIFPREYCSIHSNKSIFPREYCSIHSNKSIMMYLRVCPIPQGILPTLPTESLKIKQVPQTSGKIFLVTDTRYCLFAEISYLHLIHFGDCFMLSLFLIYH